MNPYRISPPASIGFSGGRTSGKMLWEILNAYDGELPAGVEINFENTGDEVEATLAFINEASIRWGVKINWIEWHDQFDIEKYKSKTGKILNRRVKYDVDDPSDCGFKIVSFETASRDGQPFDAMLRYYAEFRKTVKNLPPVLPNVAQRICTANLKIKVFDRYMQSRGYEDYDAVVGIRKDEPKRWTKMIEANNKGLQNFDYVMPLFDAGVTKADVSEFWSKQPFDLQIDANSDEGNCRLCFLKARHKLVKIIRKDVAANDGIVPAHVSRWANRELESGQTFRKNMNYTDLIQIALSEEQVVETEEPVIDCICGEGE